MQVESVPLFGLDQPVAAQVVPAAVVADGRRGRGQDPAHCGVPDPSSARHGWKHAIPHPARYFQDRRHLSAVASPPPTRVLALALTDALWLGGAPVRLRGVDAGRHLVAAHLEARVAVEVGLTSRVDVRHRHAALLGGPGERAGQQKGCEKRARRQISPPSLFDLNPVGFQSALAAG